MTETKCVQGGAPNELDAQVEKQNVRMVRAQIVKLKALEEIERLRVLVAEQDHIIAECSGISTGLVFAKNAMTRDQSGETKSESDGSQA